MVQPLVTEVDWSHLLRGIPEWVPPALPTLIIAPHPDDETLGCGGLIAAQRARDVDVTIAAITDGENAYADNTGLRGIRRAEQHAALARLGVPQEKIVRLEFPDSDIRSHEHELTQRITEIVTAGTLLVAPWRGDFHADHQACGRAAETAARRSGARLVSYFFWTWHMISPDSLAGLKLRIFPMSPTYAAVKASALLEHRSQLIHEGGDPILPEELLAPARRPFEVFAIS